MINPFHLAFPIKDIEETKRFYKNVLGCEIGRESDAWVDFNFFGHQLVIHETKEFTKSAKNLVDGHGVPIPHFGVVLNMEQWNILKNRLVSKKIKFIIEPYIRFKN